MTATRTIVTAINYNEHYVEELKVLLTSLDQNAPEYPVVVFLVGFEEDRVIGLRAENPSIDFISREIDKPPDQSMQVYMGCYDARAVLHVMKESGGLVAWLDTDVIVRKSLDGLWEGVGENGFKILYRRQTTEDKLKFNSGVFVVNTSPNTLAMISEWDRVVRDKREWPADQIWLYRTYLNHKDSVELIDLPPMLNNLGDSTKDKPFEDDAIIWHCKQYHFENPDFQQEHQRYIKKYNERVV